AIGRQGCAGGNRPGVVPGDVHRVVVGGKVAVAACVDVLGIHGEGDADNLVGTGLGDHRQCGGHDGDRGVGSVVQRGSGDHGRTAGVHEVAVGGQARGGGNRDVEGNAVHKGAGGHGGTRAGAQGE